MIKSQRISQAPMEVGGQSTVPVGPDPLQPDPIYAQRLGLIGGLVGGGSEKPGNIAVLAVIVGAVFICIGAFGIFFIKETGGIDGMRFLIGGGFSLVTGALGFVFGNHGQNSHD